MSPERGWLRFVRAGVHYALPLLEVREVVPTGPLSRIPRAPAAAVGLMGHQAAVVTLVDLAALESGGPGVATPLALVLDDPRRVALGVDRVEGLGSLPEGADDVRVLDRDAVLERVDLAFEDGDVVERPLSSDQEP